MTDEGDDAKQPPQVALQLRRYDLLKMLVPVAWIATVWVPLRAVQPIAQALAGKDTTVTVTVTVSIVLSIALGAGVVALLRRSSAQRQELQRQRRRISTLERELESMKQPKQLNR